MFMCFFTVQWSEPWKWLKSWFEGKKCYFEGPPSLDLHNAILNWNRCLDVIQRARAILICAPTRFETFNEHWCLLTILVGAPTRCETWTEMVCIPGHGAYVGKIYWIVISSAHSSFCSQKIIRVHSIWHDKHLLVQHKMKKAIWVRSNKNIRAMYHTYVPMHINSCSFFRIVR